MSTPSKESTWEIDLSKVTRQAHPAHKSKFLISFRLSDVTRVTAIDEFASSKLSLPRGPEVVGLFPCNVSLVAKNVLMRELPKEPSRAQTQFSITSLPFSERGAYVMERPILIEAELSTLFDPYNPKAWRAVVVATFFNAFGSKPDRFVAASRKTSEFMPDEAAGTDARDFVNIMEMVPAPLTRENLEALSPVVWSKIRVSAARHAGIIASKAPKGVRGAYGASPEELKDIETSLTDEHVSAWLGDRASSALRSGLLSKGPSQWIRWHLEFPGVPPRIYEALTDESKDTLHQLLENTLAPDLATKMEDPGFDLSCTLLALIEPSMLRLTVKDTRAAGVMAGETASALRKTEAARDVDLDSAIDLAMKRGPKKKQALRLDPDPVFAVGDEDARLRPNASGCVLSATTDTVEGVSTRATSLGRFINSDGTARLPAMRAAPAVVAQHVPMANTMIAVMRELRVLRRGGHIVTNPRKMIKDSPLGAATDPSMLNDALLQLRKMGLIADVPPLYAAVGDMEVAAAHAKARSSSQLPFHDKVYAMGSVAYAEAKTPSARTKALQDGVPEFTYVATRPSISCSTSIADIVYTLAHRTASAGPVMAPATRDRLVGLTDTALKTPMFGGISLTDEQKDSLGCLLDSRVSFIQGDPGSGKTTLISAFVLSLCLQKHALGDTKAESFKTRLGDAKTPASINMKDISKSGVLALTSWHTAGNQIRAAVNSKLGVPDEVANSMYSVSTIASVVGAFRNASRRQRRVADIAMASTLIIDEAGCASLMDMSVLLTGVAKFMKRIRHIVFVGDPVQLDPVACGAPLASILRTLEMVGWEGRSLGPKPRLVVPLFLELHKAMAANLGALEARGESLSLFARTMKRVVRYNTDDNPIVPAVKQRDPSLVEPFVVTEASLAADAPALQVENVSTTTPNFNQYVASRIVEMAKAAGIALADILVITHKNSDVAEIKEALWKVDLKERLGQGAPVIAPRSVAAPFSPRVRGMGAPVSGVPVQPFINRGSQGTNMLVPGDKVVFRETDMGQNPPVTFGTRGVFLDWAWVPVNWRRGPRGMPPILTVNEPTAYSKTPFVTPDRGRFKYEWWGRFKVDCKTRLGQTSEVRTVVIGGSRPLNPANPRLEPCLKFKNISQGYAITVNGAQGTDTPYVVMVIPGYYTDGSVPLVGGSRATKKTVVFGATSVREPRAGKLPNGTVKTVIAKGRVFRASLVGLSLCNVLSGRDIKSDLMGETTKFDPRFMEEFRHRPRQRAGSGAGAGAGPSRFEKFAPKPGDPDALRGDDGDADLLGLPVVRAAPPPPIKKVDTNAFVPWEARKTGVTSKDISRVMPSKKRGGRGLVAVHRGGLMTPPAERKKRRRWTPEDSNTGFNAMVKEAERNVRKVAVATPPPIPRAATTAAADGDEDAGMLEALIAAELAYTSK